MRRPRLELHLAIGAIVLLVGLGVIDRYVRPAARATSSLDANPSTPDPEVLRRGRALFREGRLEEGPLVGYIGADRIPLEGDLVACARCHGERGEGTRGGEIAPPIHGVALFTAVPGGDPERPARPAYDAPALGRALREGHSASNRALSWIMPRFDLSDAQLADLVAYLSAVSNEPAPGVEKDRVVVGTILPASPRWAESAEDVKRVLSAAFDDVNRAGGVYGRRIELRVLRPEDAATAGTEVFAVAAPIHADEAADVIEARDVPVIAPIGLEGTRPDGRVFTLLPGAAEQARWAVQQVLDEGSLAVIHAGDRFGLAWASAAEEECLRRALPAPTVFEVSVNDGVDRVVAELRQIGVRSALIALPPAAAAELIAASPRTVQFVAPAALARPDLPLPANRVAQVRFVYPAQPASSDGTPPAVRSLLVRHGLPQRAIAFQTHAYAAAQVVVEGLRRAGAHPTRERLVAALEALQDFDTGATPPITFGRGQHVGSLGAQWVRLDPVNRVLRIDSPWRPLSP